MPLLYPLKRVMRNWKLFVALLIGIVLASTFFAAIDIKANLAAEQALDRELKDVPFDMELRATLNQTNLAYAKSNISSVKGVSSVDAVTRFYPWLKVSSDNYTRSWGMPMVSFANTSKIFDEWINKPVEGIKENETYIIEGSNFAKNVAIGDNITTTINILTPKYYNASTVYINLTVAGFAKLTEKGYSLVTGNPFGGSSSPIMVTGISGSISGSQQIYRYQSDLMIVSWENTIGKLWSNVSNSAIDTTFLINLDREGLISPWDTKGSMEKVQTVADDIHNIVLANFEFSGEPNNYLDTRLRNFESNFSSTLMNFILVSLPVLFVAWYLGSTVSDVSFNMRRREIGLLSTKGLSSGQIQRMFLTEALAIGLIGGLLGVIGGLILNQVFIGEFNLNTLFSSQLYNPYTMVFTVAFGVILAFVSVFFSARRAARLPAVEALRDYMSSEIDRPYRKKLPWVAFILGTYKIVVFALGLNVPLLVSNEISRGGNFFTSIGYAVFVYFDLVLTYIGPLLFFWGISKLLIQNSLKFQQLTSGVSRFMGDLGALAAKNVRRSPARLAAIAFLIALIIGYSVQVTGQLASEQDYISRRVHAQAGADINLSVMNATEAQNVLNNILGNVSEVKNYTMQCRLTQVNAGTDMMTIDPDSWMASAYYEKGWFTGTDMDQAFNELKNNNMTIILERSVAKRYNYEIGDEIGIDFPSGARKLKIVGFYGPEPTETTINIMSLLDAGEKYYSYVPRNLFNMSSPFSDAYLLERFDTQILLKLHDGVNGTAVAEKIRGLNLEIYGVQSFDEQWQLSLQSSNDVTYNSLQTLDVQRLGLIFAVLSASVGTALISIVSLRERSREATLMSVRGLSYRQLVRMFLTENIAVITFSVILGLGVGIIIVYGNVASSSTVASQLVMRRFVFPTDAIASIASYVALIYGSVIVSVLIMTRQYVTKLERMIRSR